MKQIKIRVQKGKKTKVLNAIEVGQGIAKKYFIFFQKIEIY